MSLKDNLKRVKRGLARFFVMLFYYLFRILPKPIVFGFSRVMFVLFYSLVQRHRRVARESLTIAYGDTKSKEEINALAKRSLYTLGENMVEMVYYFAHIGEVPDNVEIQGREHLDAALARGKGVVAVSAHYGNFALLMYYLALQSYQVRMILRPLRDQKFGDFLEGRMQQANLFPIYSLPRNKCVTETIRTLRDNKILCMLPDQNYGADGHVFVDFFGHQAATAAGPLVFALRTGAAIVPMFIRREKDGKHVLKICPEYQVKKIDNADEMYQYNMGQISKIIEREIRAYPHEWGWIHRRWKTRPAGESEIKVNV